MALCTSACQEALSNAAAAFCDTDRAHNEARHPLQGLDPPARCPASTVPLHGVLKPASNLASTRSLAADMDADSSVGTPDSSPQPAAQPRPKTGPSPRTKSSRFHVRPRFTFPKLEKGGTGSVVLLHCVCAHSCVSESGLQKSVS